MPSQILYSGKKENIAYSILKKVSHQKKEGNARFSFITLVYHTNANNTHAWKSKSTHTLCTVTLIWIRRLIDKVNVWFTYSNFEILMRNNGGKCLKVLIISLAFNNYVCTMYPETNSYLLYLDRLCNQIMLYSTSNIHLGQSL